MHHVFSRGVARSATAVDSADYERALGFLERAVERFELRCHAWCFLPNHFHLLLTSQLGNLSSAMHWLGTCTAQTFNERYERAYGPDGWDRDRDITIRRANDDLVISRSDDLRARGLQPERRRYVRYGPSRDRIADDFQVRRPIADETTRAPIAATEPMSPAETERLRQESGDLTMDARDTLVTPPPPPTDERR